MAKRKRSNWSTSKIIAVGIAVFFWGTVISKCGYDVGKKKITDKPENVETMVMLLMSQTPTATITPIPTDTPVPTATPMPTDTPVPTNTPTEAVDWLPAVMEQSSESGILPTSVPDDACHDISCGCVIWGNVNKTKGTKIYHCPNDPNYYPQNFKASQGDQWFCTEAEATAAGFRPPKNAPACGGF